MFKKNGLIALAIASVSGELALHATDLVGSEKGKSISLITFDANPR